MEGWAAGLCSAVAYDSSFSIIEKIIFSQITPTKEDCRQLLEEGCHPVWWGSGHSSSMSYTLTPLRETILLFCAALNGELED